MSSMPLGLPLPFANAQDMHAALLSMPKFAESGVDAARFGLETVRAFCADAGSPQTAYPSVHIAGTNGKGSTCRILASILQEAGLRTGLTTSPHLLSYNERIQVDGRPIEDAEMLRFFEQHAELLRKRPLTYFELATCLAFWHFKECEVDVAVVEVGLGGRLDATNILNPAATAITSIGLDHTDVLGPTLAHIAREKAGIAKPGVHMVAGNLPEEAMLEIRKVCRRLQAPLVLAAAGGFDRVGDRFRMTVREKAVEASASSHPDANRWNGAVAVNLARILDGPGGVFEGRIPPEAVVRGLETMQERYPVQAHFTPLIPGGTWYMDGAHNEEAFSMLMRQLARKAPLESWTLVLGMMADKLTPDILPFLSRFRTRYFMEIGTPRALTTAGFNEYVQRHAYAESPFLPCPPIEAFQKRHGGELVIFTGSFYLYSAFQTWKRDFSPPR